MTVHHPHLRKALLLAQVQGQSLDSHLRKDIRQWRRRAAGDGGGGGGDFHTPFWADAKAAAFNDLDLFAATAERVDANYQRHRLYPLLEESFSRWWRPFRAQRNEPIRPFREFLTGSLELGDTGIELKIQNLLSVSAGEGFHRFIYPYFAEDPSLGEEAAGFGLASLSSAFPQFDRDCFVLLDVLRSRDFTFANTQVSPDALEHFAGRYRHVLHRWDELERGSP